MQRKYLVDDQINWTYYLSLEMSEKLPIHIREIDRSSNDEIGLVASRMRQTLIEVMGEERGSNFYSMEWLIDRVRWHLSPERVAQVFLVVSGKNEILGHAIARIDHEDDKTAFGFFSTIYIHPELRGVGVASQLVRHVNDWVKSLNVSKIVYNTAKDHSKLIYLFEKHGYQITEREGEMVRLTKNL